MKALSFVTALLVSFGAFAANQTQPPQLVAQPVVQPDPAKTLLFCDYVESQEFQLFMDVYVMYNETTGAYTMPEFGVFQGTESTQYPEYIWGHTETKVESTSGNLIKYQYDYSLTKDDQNLAFTLPGSADGITLTKVDEKIQDFELVVKGLVSENKAIDATFLCYDPSTKASQQQR